MNLTKLSPELQKFVVNITAKARKESTSIAIAKAIANMLVIPTARVDNVQAFYKANVQMTAYTHLSYLNELLILDTDLIAELIIKFYGARYEVAYPSTNLVLIRDTMAIYDFFGFGRYLSEAILETIKSEAKEIMYVHNNVCEILSQAGE